MVKNLEIPPTFFDMLISLSFNITISLVLLLPASSKASNAIPPVRAPSPITAITWFSCFFKSLALAIPSAAEIEVLLWPVLNSSYIDSFVFGKPAIPFKLLKVFIFSFLPVSILCT